MYSKRNCPNSINNHIKNRSILKQETKARGSINALNSNNHIHIISIMRMSRIISHKLNSSSKINRSAIAKRKLREKIQMK